MANPAQLPSIMNKVRCIEYDDRIIIHMPTYIFLKVNNLTGINFQTKTASFYGSLMVNINFGDLPSQWVDEIRGNIRLDIGERMNFSLSQLELGSMPTISLKQINNSRRKLLTYIIKGTFESSFSSDTTYQPFQDLTIRLSILPTVNFCRFMGKLGEVKLNCLVKYKQNDKIDMDTMVVGRDRKTYHEYAFIYEQCKVELKGQFKKAGNVKKNNAFSVKKDQFHRDYMAKKQKLDEIVRIFSIDMRDLYFIQESYPFNKGSRPYHAKQIDFLLRFTKNPVKNYVSIFLPLIFISIFNFCIYYMKNNFNQRLAAITTLIIAYTTFMPTVRQRTPVSPKLTLTDYVVIGIMGISIANLVYLFLDFSKYFKPFTRRIIMFLMFWVPLVLWIFSHVKIFYRFLQIMNKLTKIPHATHQAKPATDQQFQSWRNLKLDESYVDSMPLKLYQDGSRDDFANKHCIFERLWVWRLKNIMGTDLFINRDDIEQGVYYLRKDASGFRHFWKYRYEYPIVYRQVMPYVELYKLSLEKFWSAFNIVFNKTLVVDGRISTTYSEDESRRLNYFYVQFNRAKMQLREAYMENAQSVPLEEVEFRLAA